MYGDRLGAKAEVLNSNFSISNIVCGNSQYGWRDAARGLSLNSSVMQFVLPSSNAPLSELRALLSLLTTTELNEEIVEVKRNKQDRKIKRVRMTALVDDASSPEGKYAIPYLITISKDGDDKDRVLSIQKGVLRPGKSEYKSDSDVYPFERSVHIKWEEFENAAGKKVVLPTNVMKRFANDPKDRNRDTMIEKMTFDWKRVNVKKQIDGPKELVTKRVLANQRKVESMLNR